MGYVPKAGRLDAARDNIKKKRWKTLEDFFEIMTPTELAAKLHISPKTLAKYRANPELMRIDHYVKLAELFQIDVFKIMAIFSPAQKIPKDKVKFVIMPVISGKQMILQVEKIRMTKIAEMYRIDMKDSSGRSHIVVLSNNRLQFRGLGLKKRKGIWRVVEGQFKYESAREAICAAIEKADPEER